MEQENFLLDKNYIIATILNVKKKYCGCFFVSIKEYNIISSLIIQKLKSNNLSVIINDIDFDLFQIIDEFIIVNSKCNFDEVVSNNLILNNGKYESFFDETLIYKWICDIKDNKEILHFEKSNLIDIIDNILTKPRLFYETVAKELSKDEYEYLKEQIINKCCINCKSSCNEQNNENHCNKWMNDEIIGRQKVKI